MKYTTQQIRGAILRAADRIENAPSCYDFGKMCVPNGDCGTTACAWGWIGFELGMKPDLITWVARACRVDAPSPDRSETAHLYVFCSSIMHAEKAPSVLRAYADHYFPAEVAMKAATIPEDRQLVSWKDVAWQPKVLA